MIRRRSAILLAVGLLAPLALTSSPASGIDQDLVVSATNGPPGTEIAVTSATCVGSDEVEAYLEVAFITGIAPNEQLAGIGQGFDGAATVTVPDWVDPAEPAVIEATCFQYGVEDGTEESLDYDPVAFDVEPGVGVPVQVRTFSRTELLAGQAFSITGSCGTGASDQVAQAIVVSGTDQSGREIEDLVGEGYVETESDGSFDIPVVVSDAFVGIEVGAFEDGPESVSTYEEPITITPGDYTVYTYCSGDNDSLVFLEPSALTITGVAPTEGVDLTNEENTRNVTIAGACAQGDVSGWLEGISLEDLGGEFDAPTGPDARSARAQLLGPDGADQALIRRSALTHQGAGSARALSDEDFTDFGVSPDADGAWGFSDATSFDQGLVIGFATCGDPFADGYVYDPQGVSVEVVAAPPVVPPTTPVAPPAPPANAVSGTPTYAG